MKEVSSHPHGAINSQANYSDSQNRMTHRSRRRRYRRLDGAGTLRVIAFVFKRQQECPGFFHHHT